jgi:hypothetical protein
MMQPVGNSPDVVKERVTLLAHVADVVVVVVALVATLIRKDEVRYCSFNYFARREFRLNNYYNNYDDNNNYDDDNNNYDYDKNDENNHDDDDNNYDYDKTTTTTTTRIQPILLSHYQMTRLS